MDLANLENEQATTLFKSQAQIQALFTDQAADNAAKQFNATSQNQTDQFFASLKTQVSQFNASQQNAVKQFNADAKKPLRSPFAFASSAFAFTLLSAPLNFEP